MKNILFLDRSLTVNGTSVYYKMLSKNLKGKAKLYFYPFRSHIFYNEISKGTEVISIIKLIFRKYKIDAIYVCTAEMFIMALLIKKYLLSKTQVIYSTFHPRGNFFEKNIFGNVYNKIISNKMAESPESFVFYNETTRLSHQEYYNMSLQKSTIFPVLIESLSVPIPLPVVVDNSIVKIISLGRLVDFKYSHETVIHAISTLRREVGCKIEFHVYGDGNLLDKLEQFIIKTKSEDFVFTHGILKAEKMFDVLITADLFIGMGTAIIYSASFGIPSILAIESSQETYGFFTSDLNGFECGEDTGKGKKQSYYSVIKKFIEYNDSEIEKLKSSITEKSHGYLFEHNIESFLCLFKMRTDSKLTGLSFFNFMKVITAKIILKLLPTTVGDK